VQRPPGKVLRAGHVAPARSTSHIARSTYSKVLK
jgi:hypothetical protein